MPPVTIEGSLSQDEIEAFRRFVPNLTTLPLDFFQILRYLKECLGKGLLYQKNDYHQVEVYTDADWAKSLQDRRFTSRYYSFVGGNLVTWRSKKQFVIARSNVEVEFRAMAHDICKSLWLKMLLSEVG